MTSVEFIASSRRDDDATQLTPARLINMYREPIGEGGFALKSVLGMQRMASLPQSISQAMEVVDGTVYAAAGGRLFSIEGRNVSNLFAIRNASPTTISGNNGAVTVAANGEYYHWQGDVLTRPETGAITNVGSVDFIGQRTILTELRGRRVQWSAVANGQSFDGLDFASAEARDDDILRGVVINNLYWVFGETSIEQWGLTGGTNFISPLPGRVTDIGLLSFDLLTKIPNGAFFVGNDGIAYITDGSSMRPISSRSVETSLEESQPTHCVYYQDEGHKFCAIRFDDRPAWVYDLSANEWHERAEGATLQPWSVRHGVYSDGTSHVIAGAGDVCTLTRCNTDFGSVMVRQAVSRTLEFDGHRRSVDFFRLKPLVGRGQIGSRGVIGTGQSAAAGNGQQEGILTGRTIDVRDASVLFRTSRDFGETWSRYKQRGLGALGRYYTQVVLRALGQFRQFNVEITISDPVEVPISTIAIVEIS